jgi:chorismate mutase
MTNETRTTEELAPPSTTNRTTELALALAALEKAREQCDVKEIDASMKRIRDIRQRIAKRRTELATLASERLHLVEVVEHAQRQLLRYERYLEDHDLRMNRIREELQEMGGKPIEKPNF